jgi:hypothetical protein
MDVECYPSKHVLGRPMFIGGATKCSSTANNNQRRRLLWSDYCFSAHLCASIFGAQLVNEENYVPGCFNLELLFKLMSEKIQ